MEIVQFDEADRTALSTLYDEVRLRTFTWVEQSKLAPGTFDHDTRGEYILVAKVGGIVAGFVAIWKPDSFIHHLYVLPGFQDRGVGKRLIEAGVEQCRTQPTLKCFEANLRAIAFYTKNGWTEKGRGVAPEGNYILFAHTGEVTER